MKAPGDLFDDVIDARPSYAAALRDVEAALWSQTLVSPITLEISRLRIAALLGCEAALSHRTPVAVTAGLDEALVAALPHWPTDPGFDSCLRACLGYTEQLLIDAQGVSDELANAVIDEIGEGGFLILTYAWPL
jgi:alkylhydroperoxidase family enzyme